MRKVIFVLVAIIISGCTPRMSSRTNTGDDTATVPIEMGENGGSETQPGIQNPQQVQRDVFLPYEVAINETASLVIRENGTIEFGNNVFVYVERYISYPEITLTTHRGNNVYGINILEQVGCAVIWHTLLFNVATMEKIPFEKHRDFIFGGFFAMGSNFILTSREKAWAFDDSTGGLLWTQTFTQRSGRRITANADHLLINDANGNKYQIFGDGRKINSSTGQIWEPREAVASKGDTQ